MKNILSFLIILIAVSKIKAQTEVTTFKIKIDQEMITYQFSSVKDFEENFEKYLDEFEIQEERKRKKTSELFWVEIAIVISNQKETTTISRSINSSETTLKEDTNKLKQNVFSLLAVL